MRPEEHAARRCLVRSYIINRVAPRTTSCTQAMPARAIDRLDHLEALVRKNA
jgi:hypothetical protein